MRKLLLSLASFLLFTGTLLAQKTITGTVADDKGTPVANASVVIKGTTTGTTTKADGTFSLSVPETATELLISSIGFEPVTISIENRTVVSVSLRSTTSELENVVITGYTTTQRKKFTGATVAVAIDDVRRQPFGSFDQALQGQGAGVSVVANSGQPGANAIVRIRGWGSISGGNVPLYIMDGIEITAADFASLNQGDFDRIDILKDAVATAMYGSRGANGVIVITTRRGRAGQLNLNYDAQVGFSTLPEDRLLVMNSQQKIDYELRRGNPYGWSAAEADSLRNVNFSWRDALFQTGVTHQHMLSASGGSATTRFFGSLSYMDQEGIVQTTGLKRYTARINVDNNIKNWRFGISLQGGYSKIVATAEGDTYLSTPLNAIRWSNPYERDKDPFTGEYQETGGAGTGQLGSGQPNGAMELFLNANSSLQVKGVAISYLEFHFPFLDGLYARTNWGIDYGQVEASGYTDRRTSVGVARQGALTRTMSRTLRYTGTTSLNYKKRFGAHDIEAGLFTEAVKGTSRNFGFTGYGLTNGFTNEAGITAGSVTNPNYIPAVAGGGTMNGILSYFTILNYGYNDRYYLTAVGRRDGASRFGINNRFANFGSVGLTWIISEENFMQTVGFINELKIRASVGTNGNSNTAAGDFGQFPLLGRISYGGVNGWAPATPGNLEYRWETNRTINFGLDFAVLNNRLSGTVELYDRKTKNLFYLEPIAPEGSGFPNVPGNEGTLRNRGIEFTLRGDVVRSRDFRWTVEGNITYNKNKILYLPDDSIASGTTILAIGKPLGSFYLVEYAGVNSANGNALYYTRDGHLTQTHSPNERKIYGTSISPLFGSLSTTVFYKGIDLSAQVNFFLDRQMFNNDRNNLINPQYFYDNMSVEVLREWQKPGDITDVPRPTSSNGNPYQAQTTRLLEDADFWRLRNVTLGYTVPASILNKVKIRSLRIFIQGQNWWTKTKYQSFDPEFSGASLIGAQYPALVQTTAGLSLGF